MATTVTGKVVSCNVRRVANRFGGDPRADAREGRERYLVRMRVELTGINGTRYLFDSPAVRMSVRSAGGAAVVLFRHEGDSASWFEITDGSGVATADRPNTRTAVPRIKVGDDITVRGTMKAEHGGVVSMNRVRMIGGV